MKASQNAVKCRNKIFNTCQASGCCGLKQKEKKKLMSGHCYVKTPHLLTCFVPIKLDSFVYNNRDSAIL